MDKTLQAKTVSQIKEDSPLSRSNNYLPGLFVGPGLFSYISHPQLYTTTV